MSNLVELEVVELFWHTTIATPVIIDMDDIAFIQPMVERYRSAMMQDFIKSQKEYFEKTEKLLPISDVPINSCIIHLKSCGGIGDSKNPTPRVIIAMSFDDLKRKLGMAV